jgi:hypothetical protein
MWYPCVVGSGALDWLHSPDAGVAARRELKRLRLPESLEEDVLQSARIRAWRLAERHDTAPDNPVAVGYRTVQQAVGDLYRRGRRRVRELNLEDYLPVLDSRPVDFDGPGDLEDDSRRAAHGTLATRPWVGAAVLNELTFRLHPDVPIPDGAPAPKAGDDEQHLSWASLWLAGRIDCFPNGRVPDDPAMRQRRSRALDAAALGLREVVAVALAGASG